MIVGRNLLSGKRKYLFAWAVLSVVSVLCMAFSMTGGDDFATARREVLLRRIGHEVLLHSGDSTSLVLPVKRIGENEYHIRFDNDFTFQPASLVDITRRVLAEDPRAGDYVINVVNCNDATVAYGYAISKNKKDDIVACIGRKQPVACYLIDIRFKPTGIISAENGFLVGSLPILAFVGFLFLKSVRPRQKSGDSLHAHIFTLGAVAFDARHRKLTVNEKTMDLTATETRVLRIFALSPNEAISRSRLQKEIWEDEGIVVGRSLDVFISKLRKKLEADANIRIVVIRGKGYKLEIGSSKNIS